MTINPHAKDSPDDVHEFILRELSILRRQLSEAIDRERLLFGVVAPRFSGENPTEWIYGIERYFDLSLTTESDRLELVPLLIDSPASEWLSFFQKNNPEASWQEFLLALHHHFATDFCEDVDQFSEDAFKLAPQFAASHAKSLTNGSPTPKDDVVTGVLINSVEDNVLSPVVVPPGATLLAANSSKWLSAIVYDSKAMKLSDSTTMKLPDRKTTAMSDNKTTATPNSRTTALPDSTATAQHDHSLLTYCEDVELGRASRQLGAETEVHIFDPGDFDGVEFIHVEPDRMISEDAWVGGLASQIEEAKFVQSTAVQSSNGFTSLAASQLLSTFKLRQGDETALSHGNEGNGSDADGDCIQPENTIFFFVPDSTEWCQHGILDEIVIEKAGFVSPVSKHVKIAECFDYLVNISTSVGSRIRATILGIKFQRQEAKWVDTTEMYGAFFVEGETHTDKVKKCSKALREVAATTNYQKGFRLEPEHGVQWLEVEETPQFKVCGAYRSFGLGHLLICNYQHGYISINKAKWRAYNWSGSSPNDKSSGNGFSKFTNAPVYACIEVRLGVIGEYEGLNLGKFSRIADAHDPGIWCIVCKCWDDQLIVVHQYPNRSPDLLMLMAYFVSKEFVVITLQSASGVVLDAPEVPVKLLHLEGPYQLFDSELDLVVLNKGVTDRAYMLENDHSFQMKMKGHDDIALALLIVILTSTLRARWISTVGELIGTSTLIRVSSFQAISVQPTTAPCRPSQRQPEVFTSPTHQGSKT